MTEGPLRVGLHWKADGPRISIGNGDVDFLRFEARGEKSQVVVLVGSDVLGAISGKELARISDGLHEMQIWLKEKGKERGHGT